MIEESAVVKSVANDSIEVQAQVKTGCSSCKANKVCGHSLLHDYFKEGKGLIKIPNPQINDNQSRPISEGDEIIIGIEESVVLKGAFLVYMLPLLFVIIGTLLLSYFAIVEAFLQLTLVLAFFLMGFLLARRLLSSSKDGVYEGPVFVRFGEGLDQFSPVKMCD